MRNRTKWDILLEPPREITSKFRDATQCMVDTERERETRENWKEKSEERRNVSFQKEQMIGKGWRRWRGTRKRRSRFTFYEVNWMRAPPSPLSPPPSSCRKIAYNDGGGTEPMEAQNGYYLRRRRHSWLSFWFTSCPLDLILPLVPRTTPERLAPLEFSDYDERN